MSDKNSKMTKASDNINEEDEQILEGFPKDIEEILEGMPEDQRKHVRQMVVSSFQMGGMIPTENTISKKITEDHITQFLEGSKINMEHSYAEKKQRKIFAVVAMILTMGFIIAIIVILKDNPDIMEKIIYTIAGLIAGAFGGYGIGKRKNSDDE